MYKPEAWLDKGLWSSIRICTSHILAILTRQSNSREATQEADAMHRALFPEYENYENHHMYIQRSGNAQLPSPVIGEDLLAELDSLTLIKKTMYNSPTN